MPARQRYGAIAALLLWTVSVACMASDFESALREADRVRSSEPARFLELLDELDGRQSEADEGQRQRLAYLEAFRKVVYDNATYAGNEQAEALFRNADDTDLTFRAGFPVANPQTT